MRDTQMGFLWVLLCAVVWLAAASVWADNDDDAEPSGMEALGGMDLGAPMPKLRMAAPMASMDMDLGVTPGGAQDISWFRDQVANRKARGRRKPGDGVRGMR